MSGHAIKDITPITSKELPSFYNRVYKKLDEIFSFEANSMVIEPIGSFVKKTGNFYGDLDLALGTSYSAQEITRNLSVNNIECKLILGFNQVSFKFEDHQVDLMITKSMDWIKFAYHSPDFTKQESKYKGLYRTALLQSIVNVINKEIKYVDEEGNPTFIESYSMRLHSGIHRVTKSYIGKSGKLIKTPTIVEDHLVTNNPRTVCEKFLGTTDEGKANSFESLWELIHKEDYFYANFVEEIVRKFKTHLEKGKYSFPVECYEYYPDIFGATTKRIAIIPGGFKPWTPAHYSLVKSALLYASEVVVIIGPSERDGITQEMSIEIGNKLFKDYPEITLVASDVSPIKKLYSWIEAEEREPGEYMLFTSTKEDDFKRAEEFYNSYKKGGKFRHNLPPHVDAADPTIYKGIDVFKSFLGEPISATDVRKAILANDKKEFYELYKTMPHETREFIWNITTQNNLQTV